MTDTHPGHSPHFGFFSVGATCLSPGQHMMNSEVELEHHWLALVMTWHLSRQCMTSQQWNLLWAGQLGIKLSSVSKVKGFTEDSLVDVATRSPGSPSFEAIESVLTMDFGCSDSRATVSELAIKDPEPPEGKVIGFDWPSEFRGAFALAISINAGSSRSGESGPVVEVSSTFCGSESTTGLKSIRMARSTNCILSDDCYLIWTLLL